MEGRKRPCGGVLWVRGMVFCVPVPRTEVGGEIFAPVLPLSPHEALDGQPEPHPSDSLPD